MNIKQTQRLSVCRVDRKWQSNQAPSAAIAIQASRVALHTIFQVGVLDTELTNLIHKVGYPEKLVMLRSDMSGSTVLQ